METSNYNLAERQKETFLDDPSLISILIRRLVCLFQTKTFLIKKSYPETSECKEPLYSNRLYRLTYNSIDYSSFNFDHSLFATTIKMALPDA